MLTTIKGQEASVILSVDENSIDIKVNGMYIVGIRRSDGTLHRYQGMKPSSAGTSICGLAITADGRIKIDEAS